MDLNLKELAKRRAPDTKSGVFNRGRAMMSEVKLEPLPIRKQLWRE